MKDSQDWLDEILETEPHRTGLHEDSGNGDPCYCTTKSAIRKHILQEALEIIGEDDDASLVRVGGGKSEILPTEKNQLRQELRNKFNDTWGGENNDRTY